MSLLLFFKRHLLPQPTPRTYPAIEAWVTTPAAAYLAHLDRSEASPFRKFAVSRMRGADPGAGSLEYHLDNALVGQIPTLFADGNLVWMKYRGRTMTWIIEERATVLDENEHETDWVGISGRGVKQLVGDRVALPPAFAEGANLNPATWGEDAQWRRFTNRAAGEMLWDLISETNGFITARGGAAIVRGTVQTTGADGWTQDLKFDNLLDVVKAVTASYGEVEFEGLTFHYYNDPGIDRSATVIFEEGADLIRVERARKDRDTISWVVAEGVGEGVFAKLAVAENPTVARPRMAFLDAKDAGNLPLVQLQANAAIDEHKPIDSISIEVDESRWEAFTDYDLHDTVRVIAPSRGVDETAVIVAMYLAEGDDDRVRVEVDVNSPREEYLLRLEEGNRSTARSLGVLNRQPQGQMVPIPISGADVLDSTDTMDVFLKLTDRAYVIIQALVTLRFREFFAAAKSAAAGGGSTSGSSSASSSGSSSASSSDSSTEATSGSSSASSSNNTSLSLGFSAGEGIHDHSNPEGGFTGIAGGHDHLTSIAPHLHGIAHTHQVLAHSHPIPHTHGIAHTHDIQAHTHELVFGVEKEPLPASWSVTLKVYKRSGSSWILEGEFGGLTEEIEDLDLTAVIDTPGDWRLELKSDAAQPNGGRLGCDVYGLVWVAVKSA